MIIYRLKCLLRLLDKGEVRPEVVQKNLKLAIQVLDSVYVDEAGRWVFFSDSIAILVGKMICLPFGSSSVRAQIIDCSSLLKSMVRYGDQTGGNNQTRYRRVQSIWLSLPISRLLDDLDGQTTFFRFGIEMWQSQKTMIRPNRTTTICWWLSSGWTRIDYRSQSSKNLN